MIYGNNLIIGLFWEVCAISAVFENSELKTDFAGSKGMI